MNKILVSAAFALAVIASGNAFADTDLDESLYAEASFIAGNDATGVVSSPAPLSPETAALYDETTFGAVAAGRSVDLGEQLADSGFGQFHGWTGSSPAKQTTFAQPE